MYFYAPEIRGHIGGIQYLGPCGALRGQCASSLYENGNDKMGFGKDGKGVIISESREQTLGTLAANTGLIIGTKLAIVTRFRMLKSEVTLNLVATTSGEAGGLQLYLADGDLTLVEFEAAIEQQGPLGANDIASAEKALRPTWIVGGMFDRSASVDGTPFHGINGGPLMEAKPRWTFGIGKSWNWIIFNHGLALTTGSTAKVKAKNYGVWVT